MSLAKIFDRLVKRENTNNYIYRNNQKKRSLALFLSAAVFIGSIGGAIVLAAQQLQIQSTQAAANLTCPNGGVLNPTSNTCLVDPITSTKQNACPRGGELTNDKCVATLTNPVDRSGDGCFAGGKEVATNFGRGGEVQHDGKVCALPSQFSKIRGGRQGVVQLTDLKPAYLSLDQDSNPNNGVQTKACESPNLGYNAQLISSPSRGVDIRQKLNSSHYMSVVNMDNTLICGYYDNQSFSTPQARDSFEFNKTVRESGECEFGSIESCTEGNYYNQFYYYPGAVFSNYSYDSTQQNQCPTGFAVAGGGKCAYPAVAGGQTSQDQIIASTPVAGLNQSGSSFSQQSTSLSNNSLNSSISSATSITTIGNGGNNSEPRLPSNSITVRSGGIALLSLSSLVSGAGTIYIVKKNQGKNNLQVM